MEKQEKQSLIQDRRQPKGYVVKDTTLYRCRYHVVFASKYRRKVFREEIAERLKQIVSLMATEDQGFSIVGPIDVGPDRVHIVLDIDPDISVGLVVTRIKRRTSNLLRKEFPELVRKLPALWSRSKLVVSVGVWNENIVEIYLRSQSRRSRPKTGQEREYSSYAKQKR